MAIVVTADSGFLLAGYSSSGIGGEKSQVSRGDSDYWVVKIDATGKKVGDKTYGGSDLDWLTAMIPIPAGGYLLGGYSRSSIGGDKSEVTRGHTDFWIIKIQEQATPPHPNTWNLRYGGSGVDRFTVVIKTRDGGYLSGGYSNSPVSGDKSQNNRGGADYWIVKTDEKGAKQWDRRYGGSNHDYLNRIIPTSDGGYLLAGSSTSGKGGDKNEGNRGDQDYWIVKISNDGTKQWDKTYGGSGFDDLRKVNQLSNGDYLLAGTSASGVSGDKTQPSQGGKDYWIVRIDQVGNKRWDKTYGGSEDENLESFTKISNGEFLLAGSSASGISGNKSQVSRGSKDYWLVRINSNGTLLWDKSYGGDQDDELYSVGITSSGEYFVAGHSSSGQSGDKTQASQGNSDYWMLKLSNTGEKLWDKSFGGSGVETLRSIIEVRGGGYVLAGSSNSPISGDKTQASQGGMDYWIIKTDAEGNKQYDQRYGGAGEEELRYIQRAADGGLLLGGRSESGVSGNRTQPSQGQMDYWLVKIAPVKTTPTTIARVVAKSETLAAVNLNAFPNPTIGHQVIVTFTVPQTQFVNLRVHDSQGRVLNTLFEAVAQAGQEYKSTWFVKNQSTGMYFLRLQTPSKACTQKLIVSK
ncbi:T9SS type A sorting domain-containing protein [Adhaeribacter swui]|uniref:T9SS type A sorting domain-containing protein n=1 Tax=Adhaeribacter swui TaxID=2086471 RepID=A0A7G7GB72_9BACT|nr:T9SS type A sorting domain-containing protein [Adhaeribacter swui]QNF34406.1 T9SS type A sorting domain-containing protein [Adhaeribacter swui]